MWYSGLAIIHTRLARTSEDSDENMMPEFPKFKEKINCENVPFSKRVRIDNFEIQGRLSAMEKLLK